VKVADPTGYLARIELGEPVVPHLPVDAAAAVEEQCRSVLARIAG
jgi:hypothetical protein